MSGIANIGVQWGEGMMGPGWGGGMMGGWGWPLAVSGVFAVIALVAVVFWLWMLVDCLQRPDKGFPAKGSNDKLIWALVLLLTNILGAVLYYLMVRSKK